MPENEQQENEIEVINLTSTISKVKDAFSTSSEAFARRIKSSLEDLDSKFTNNIESHERLREEQGLSTSKEFEEYNTKLKDIINDAKSGKSVSDREDIVNQLKVDEITLEQLAVDTDVDLDFNELEILKEAIGVLVKEINPRTLSRRILETAGSAASGIAEGAGREIGGGVQRLQGAIEDLAEEFPPVQFALEKTNQFLNFVVSKLFGVLKSAFARRREAKENVAAIKERASEAITKIPGSPRKPKASRPNTKGTSSTDNGMLTRSSESLVHIHKESIKRISKSVAKEFRKTGATKANSDGTSPVQQALLTSGAVRFFNRRQRPATKAKRPGLLARLLPFIVSGVGVLVSLVTGFIPAVMGALSAIVAWIARGALFKAIARLGPKIVGLGSKIIKGLGPKLSSMAAALKTGFTSLAPRLAGALGLGTTAATAAGAARGAGVATTVATGATAAATSGKLLKTGGKVLGATARLASKAFLPLTIVGSLAQGIYRGYKSYQAGGDFGDIAKATGSGALSFATAGLSDLAIDPNTGIPKGDPDIKRVAEVKNNPIHQVQEANGIQPIRRRGRSRHANRMRRKVRKESVVESVATKSNGKLMIDNVGALEVNMNSLSAPVRSTESVNEMNKMAATLSEFKVANSNSGNMQTKNSVSNRSLINNNNVTKSTFVTKSTPENHETTYIEKSKGAFAS